jgi:Flp pilus assembly protein TadG
MVSRMTKPRRRRSRLLPFLRLARDRSGVSAVEFALLLPLMLTLYFGAVEFGDALTIERKVTHLTSSLADLVTQARTISDEDMDNILDAAASIIIPYDEGLLAIKVSGVSIDANGKATVTWSDARNDTPLPKGSVVSLPDGVKQPNTFLVTAEIHYTYTPTVGYLLTGSFDLMDQFFLRPRLSDTVNRVAG